MAWGWIRLVGRELIGLYGDWREDRAARKRRLEQLEKPGLSHQDVDEIERQIDSATSYKVDDRK